MQTSHLPVRCGRRLLLIAINVYLWTGATVTAAEQQQAPWESLWDGRSLQGWRVSPPDADWRIVDGQLTGPSSSSRLFYEGPVAGHDFGNFELEVEARTVGDAAGGIGFHTRYQGPGALAAGHFVPLVNTDLAHADWPTYVRTGSLAGVRHICAGCVEPGDWFTVRVRVVGPRICVWVNGFPTVDYVEPPSAVAEHGAPPMERAVSRGTVALDDSPPGGRVVYRSVRVRVLPDDEPPALEERASTDGYGIMPGQIEQLTAAGLPFIDLHIHLRGGMDPAKALLRQAVTGMNCGVLENEGRGWPLETEQDLRQFLDAVQGLPLLVGIQANDRDWMTRHNPELLRRLDYVLADTMIMPMPHDDSPPVKLWIADQYTIDDPQQWMERYLRHNLRVLSEPINILANPTYLPPGLEDQYDQLWTDDRMRQVIQAALDNQVALEINASSPWPHERFIRMAKRMGAKFTFGSNNFDDVPIDMSRCLRAIRDHHLTPEDLFVPRRGRTR